MDEAARLRQATRMIWATACCFLVGAAFGSLVLPGVPRPIAGDGSVGLPMAAIAGAVAAVAFVVSTFLHRRGETAPMPRWQAVVSDLSAIALTVAYAAVTAMGVLLAAEVLAAGLEGLELPALGGGLLAGVAAALGGRVAFRAGIGLRTGDLAELLFGYLFIGTLFAMLTATDPRWWERNFSQLGMGAGAWAFNGTLVVAGLLIATVGSYVGRDLHRLQGDAALGRIAWIVVLWAATGLTLAAVGVFPVGDAPVGHTVAAFATLVLFVLAAVLTTVVMSGPPRPLILTTAAVVVLTVVAVLLWQPFGVYATTALEAIVVGLGLLWMTTLVQVLGVLAPARSRPSARESLLAI